MQKRFLGLALLFAFAGSGYLVDKIGLEGTTYFIDLGYWAVQIWYIRHFYRNNVKIKTLLASLCLIISLIASLLFIAGHPVPNAWEVWRSLSAIILVVLILGDDDSSGGNYIDDKLFSGESVTDYPVITVRANNAFIHEYYAELLRQHLQRFNQQGQCRGNAL